MSKKLEKIALNNIKEQLKEVENRARLARNNMQRFKNNPTITQIGTQNVLYAVYQLRTDIEKFLEVTNNDRQ
jgi:hypothetical protein